MSDIDDVFLCRGVGMQLMDRLNGSEMLATMGTEVADGSYQFILGPVYVPNKYVTIGTYGANARQVHVTISAIPE